MNASRKFLATAAATLLLSALPAMPAQARPVDASQRIDRQAVSATGGTGTMTPQVSVCDLLPWWPTCSRRTR